MAHTLLPLLLGLLANSVGVLALMLGMARLRAATLRGVRH